MTEEEKDKLRAAKVDVTARLAAMDIDRYRLSEVDSRLDEYVRMVAADPDGHNLWEQLAVLRFFGMIDKYGINLTEVQLFFDFYESLYFPGKSGHQRYKLTPVQAFQFASIFAFWEDGRRVVREVVLYVPRKFSKTTSTASLAIYDVLYGDANAECYTGANSSDQAKKCFDVIRGCFRRLDPKERRYTVNEQQIKSRRRDRSAFAQCLTANARTKDGLNASTVIMDEFSQAKDSELLTVLIWAEAGTQERQTKPKQGTRRRAGRMREQHRTGRMKRYGFMEQTLNSVRDTVTADIHNLVLDNVEKIAKKYGCK